METTTLMMYFITSNGDKQSLSIDDPRIDLTSTDVKDAMESIIADNVLYGKAGADLTHIHSAQIVTRTVSALEMDY